jgi:hypothetical protein
MNLSEIAGLTDNSNCGQYRNGIRYGLEQWVDVGKTLMYRPSISLRDAAKLHRVGKGFISTVRTEMIHGNLPEKIDSLRSPRLKQIRTRGPGGPGALLINGEIKESILQQHKRNPHSFLLIYQQTILRECGVNVSTSVIGRWLNSEGMTLRVTSRSPASRYSDRNYILTCEYLNNVSNIDPHWLVFHDEKPLSARMLKIKARRNINGILNQQVAPLNHRRSIQIEGFIQCTSNPIYYRISYEITNQYRVESFFYSAILAGFFRPHQIVIVDRASTHLACIDRLRSALYYGTDQHGVQLKIQVLVLPVATCQLNPIELVWNIISERCKSYLAVHQDWTTSMHDIAKVVMDGLTYEDIVKVYKKAGYPFT